MMGTAQRDLFVPTLRATAATYLPTGGHVFDVGAGDGQTFALIADVMPAGTTVSFEAPNLDYFADYRDVLTRLTYLQSGCALSVGFDDLDAVAEHRAADVPADASQDLVMALHMIYCLADLPAGLSRMARFVRPGGMLFIVFADETTGYMGCTGGVRGLR